MSDTIATTAAPAPVTATPAAPAEVTPVTTQAPTPKTAAEARAAIAPPAPAGLTAREAQAALSNGGLQLQPRNEDGSFKAAGEPAATETAAAPAAPADTPAPDPAAELGSPAEGFVRIPLSPDHPLASKGAKFLDAPADQEQYFRWAVNNAVRREQVVQWEQHAAKLEARANELAARERALAAELRAVREFGERAVSDPVMSHMLKDLETTYGPEAAAALRRGLLAEQVQPKVEQYRAEIETAEADAYAERVANTFVSTAYQQAVEHFPLFTPAEFDHAVATYGHLMEVRGKDTPDVNEFLQHAAGLYMTKPEVQAELTRRREAELAQAAEKARLAEAERLKKEEADRIRAAADARKNLPFRGIPAGESGRSLPLEVGPTTAKDARQGLFRRNRA